MARSGLGDGTGGKPTAIRVVDPMSIESPAKAAAKKATNNMQQQAQGASGAKTMTIKRSPSSNLDAEKAAMLPRQEEDDVAGRLNGVGAFIDGYLRINKRRYQANSRGRQSAMIIG
jgi:hypothetical protein